MAFSFFVNNISDGNYGPRVVYNLKERLKAQGWTVQSSSDGTTYNAAADIITSGEAGAGGMNNSRAWFRIRMPTLYGLVREFTFQRTSAVDSDSFRIKYSSNANFTGGSPAATVTPSASDEVVLWGAGTDAVPTFLGFYFGLVDGNPLTPLCPVYYHICAGGAAEDYMFYWVANPAGNSQTVLSATRTTPISGMVFEPLISSSVAAEDTDPFIIHISSIVSSGASRAFTYSGLTGTNPNIVSNLLVPRTRVTMCGYNYANMLLDGPNLYSQALGINPYNSKDDMLPIGYGRKVNTSVPGPIGGAPFGWKGLGRYMYWMMSVDRTNGDTFTVSTTRDRINFGDIVLPWNGSVPSI